MNRLAAEVERTDGIDAASTSIIELEITEPKLTYNVDYILSIKHGFTFEPKFAVEIFIIYSEISVDKINKLGRSN